VCLCVYMYDLYMYDLCMYDLYMYDLYMYDLYMYDLYMYNLYMYDLYMSHACTKARTHTHQTSKQAHKQTPHGRHKKRASKREKAQ